MILHHLSSCFYISHGKMFHIWLFLGCDVWFFNSRLEYRVGLDQILGNKPRWKHESCGDRKTTKIRPNSYNICVITVKEGRDNVYAFWRSANNVKNKAIGSKLVRKSVIFDIFWHFWGIFGTFGHPETPTKWPRKPSFSETIGPKECFWGSYQRFSSRLAWTTQRNCVKPFRI